MEGGREREKCGKRLVKKEDGSLMRREVERNE